MWTVNSNELIDRRGRQFTLHFERRPMTFGHVVDEWRNDRSFRTFFNAILADCSYTAFRWETPAVTEKSANRPFEFVLLDSPELERTPDSKPFVANLQRAKQGVSVFPNLGGDALLVVPTALSDSSAYGHIAAFVRFAPEAQRDALWAAVGEAMATRIAKKPVWLSTAGAGVSWLHIRLDDRPKYYGFDQYRKLP
jgi:hypothetical protein